jgi:hypothetical protein
MVRDCPPPAAQTCYDSQKAREQSLYCYYVLMRCMPLVVSVPTTCSGMSVGVRDLNISPYACHVYASYPACFFIHNMYMYRHIDYPGLNKFSTVSPKELRNLHTGAYAKAKRRHVL